MKPVRYHPEANEEVIESSLFYEDREDGLGARFLTALEDAEHFIQSFPRRVYRR